jgi:hypothetical protein
MFVHFEGLLAASYPERPKSPEQREASQGGELVGIGAHAKTRPRDESLPLGRDTSTPRGITSTSLLDTEHGGYVDPVVQRYLESGLSPRQIKF